MAEEEKNNILVNGKERPDNTTRENTESQETKITKLIDAYKLPFSKRLIEYKVLLVKTAIKHPINDEDFGIPMGLYVLKDYLKTTGHNLVVDIWDERLELKKLNATKAQKDALKKSNELFVAKLSENYDAVGISVCTAEVLPALEKFRIVKECDKTQSGGASAQRKNTITFCGGIFTSSNEKCLIETDLIDFVIPGVATKPLGDLLVKLYRQKKGNLDEVKEGAHMLAEQLAIDIPGVATKRNIANFKSMWTCSQLPTMQLSMWPEILAQYKEYLAEEVDGKKCYKIGVYTARGCSRECKFCSVQRESKQIVYRRNEGCVVDEIKYLIQQGFKYFSLKDEDFLIDHKRATRIFKEVEGSGVKFKIRARYDKVAKLRNGNRNFLSQLKNFGVHEIQYGIETFDKIIRAHVNKPYIDYEGEEELIEFINDHAKIGIVANCSFILGITGENEKYYNELIRLIKRIDMSKPCKPKIYLNYLTPHPYDSKFIESDSDYLLVTTDLNYFTHRYPVCFQRSGNTAWNKMMLQTHNEIASQTGSSAYNPALKEEDKVLEERFINKLQPRDFKPEINLLRLLEEHNKC